MPLVYPLLEPQLKRYRSEPKLKEHSSKSLFKVSSKPCRPRTSKANKYATPTLLPDVALEPPSEVAFHTVWWIPQTARSHAPLKPLILQLLPRGMNPIAKRHTL
ncbi:hypothetical protein DEO72_LG11g1438 [Vigna unguiculata]|uniref:Uncharacterized protein n=1 Tax=Vigna unguiculata TaxID=3917 RepID=A0A4D6NM90_VIGUN|nr:hypothetical protein DEO72_LG11g1438 [Vigna unguiculata]